jgi:hypothetical protein
MTHLCFLVLVLSQMQHSLQENTLGFFSRAPRQPVVEQRFTVSYRAERSTQESLWEAKHDVLAARHTGMHKVLGHRLQHLQFTDVHTYL